MPVRVVDASVLGAIAFHEPRADEAASLIRGADLFAPPLLAYEMANVARKRILLHKDQEEAFTEALRLVLAMGIEWVEVSHEAALKLALNNNLSTYDASYLYVSQYMEAPLVTFDDRLKRAARSVGRG